MAHQLDFSKGRAGMAYVGERPWHGLGTLLTDDADLDQWRIAAGLDYQVEKRQLSYPVNRGQDTLMEHVEGRFALVRDDTQKTLGLCSAQYQILQPLKALQFIYDMCQEVGGKLETAGALSDGKRIWALGNMGESMRVKGQDEVRRYTMFSSSFDGSSGSIVGDTAIRVVCNNTFQYAVKQDGHQMVSVPHSTAFDADAVRKQLELRREGWAQFEEDANHLAETPVTEAMMTEFIRRLLGPTALQVKDDQVKASPTAQNIVLAAGTGPGHELRSAKGTLWGLYQGVTHYYDHKVRAKSDDTRLNSAWFGNGNATKNQALTIALNLAKAA